MSKGHIRKKQNIQAALSIAIHMAGAHRAGSLVMKKAAKLVYTE